MGSELQGVCLCLWWWLSWPCDGSGSEVGTGEGLFSLGDDSWAEAAEEGEGDGEVVGTGVAAFSTMVGVVGVFSKAVGVWVDEEMGVVMTASTKMSFWAPWTKLYKSW